MNEAEYPALYQSANKSSSSAQASYHWLIRLQYLLLFSSALVPLFSTSHPWVLVLYPLLVTGSAGLLIFMAIQKPERDWYACRALAESIKTATWRFMMRAAPFEDVDSIHDAKGKFAAYLRDILAANKHIDVAISRHPVKGEQISDTMLANRALDLTGRIALYRKHRIDDQQVWYVEKARANRNSFRRWIVFCVLIQVLAIGLAIIRIRGEDFLGFWPTEPLLVLASATVGWIQIKKFTELASAYGLTAHEIGLIRVRSEAVKTEDELSGFVGEAELGFSREHTQWIARQTIERPTA